MKSFKIIMIGLFGILSLALSSCRDTENGEKDNDVVAPADEIVNINVDGNIVLNVEAGEEITVSRDNEIEFVFESGRTENIILTDENIEEFDIVISFDLFSQEATIEVLDLYTNAEIAFAEDVNYVMVTESQELRDALIDTDVLLILVPAETFEIDATHIVSEKVIIGECEELSVIEVTGRVSSQASLLFQRQVTIKNLTIDAYIADATSGRSALKISLYHIDGVQHLVENVLLKNITINGAGGLNIHGVRNAILDGVTVCVNTIDETPGHFTALTFAISVVTMRNNVIGTGTVSSGLITHGDSSELFCNYGNHPMQIILESNNQVENIFYIYDFHYEEITENNINADKEGSPMVGPEMQDWFRMEISNQLLDNAFIIFAPLHVLPLL